ncbi:hypothetical protein [Idiomarina sp.]|uniref:hypothetical protein n=1 Tax=Idiomarina sp. TaxID=1874361 RepID=UPI0025886B85|nr:hypothetical protein [Idiomarina sp.]
MNFELILFDCIKYAPERSAKSASNTIGVSPSTFGIWLRCSKSRRFPSVDYLPAISKLSGHDLNEVVKSYMIARAEKPETKQALEDLVA